MSLGGAFTTVGGGIGCRVGSGVFHRGVGECLIAFGCVDCGQLSDRCTSVRVTALSLGEGAFTTVGGGIGCRVGSGVFHRGVGECLITFGCVDCGQLSDRCLVSEGDSFVLEQVPSPLWWLLGCQVGAVSSTVV